MAILVERRLRRLGERIRAVRAELSRLDEEVVELDDARGDAELRSIVSESPGAAAEYHDAAKHHGVIARERERLQRELTRLRQKQDELLDKLPKN